MIASYQRPRPVKRRQTHTVLIVEAKDASFDPHNWRQRPAEFKVVNRIEFNGIKGRAEADTKRFCFNYVAIDQGSACNRWAVKGGTA